MSLLKNNLPLIQALKSLFHKTKQWKKLKSQRANLWIDLTGNWRRKQKMIIVTKEIIGWKDKKLKDRRMQDSKSLTRILKKKQKRKFQRMNSQLLSKLWSFNLKVKLRDWLVISLLKETQMKLVFKKRNYFLKRLVLKDLCIGILVLFKKWSL